MQDLDDLLRGLETQNSSTDRTVYIRETPNGPVVDFEVIEKTSFEHEFPETTKEYHYKSLLPCGHQVTKENPFGGYCKLCDKEYCAKCLFQCPKCGVSVSTGCCVKAIEDVLLCKKCGNKIKRKARLFKLWAIISHPFLAEEPEDE